MGVGRITGGSISETPVLGVFCIGFTTLTTHSQFAELIIQYRKLKTNNFA
jgi:hypothetical protein